MRESPVVDALDDLVEDLAIQRLSRSIQLQAE